MKNWIKISLIAVFLSFSAMQVDAFSTKSLSRALESAGKDAAKVSKEGVKMASKFRGGDYSKNFKFEFNADKLIRKPLKVVDHGIDVTFDVSKDYIKNFKDYSQDKIKEITQNTDTVTKHLSSQIKDFKKLSHKNQRYLIAQYKKELVEMAKDHQEFKSVSPVDTTDFSKLSEQPLQVPQPKKDFVDYVEISILVLFILAIIVAIVYYVKEGIKKGFHGFSKIKGHFNDKNNNEK